MSSIAGLSCETCKYRHQDTTAVQYCSECEEGLCADCYTHHAHSKTSKNHGVIAIEDYDKLPIFIQNVKHYCKDHDEKYEFYCPSHEASFCKHALTTDHKVCKDVKPLSDVIKNAKKSQELIDINMKIEKFRQITENVLKAKETNLAQFRGETKKLQKDIQDFREKINNMLAELEKEIQDNLSSVENKIVEESDEILSELNNRKEELDILKDDINAITNYATEFQTFIGIKDLKAEIEEADLYLKSLADDKRLQNVSITCEFDKKVQSFMTEVQKFGEIKLDKSPIKDLFATAEARQRQVSLPSPPKNTSFDKEVPKTPKPQTSSRTATTTKISAKRTLAVPPGKNNNNVTSGIILPNGKFVFVDGTFNQRLVIMNSNGTTSGEIALSSNNAFDVTFIENKTIAVSSDSQIAIVNAGSKKLKTTFATAGECDGLCHVNGKLIYVIYQKGIKMLDLKTEKITFLHKENLPADTYLAALDERIYHSNWKSETVTCYNLKGQIIWTFSDKKLIQKPRGISVDGNHTVYVASTGSDSIVSISADGKQGKELLSKKDGIENVRSIYYDKASNGILVCSLTGSASLFEI